MTKLLFISRMSIRTNSRSNLIATTLADLGWQVTALSETQDYSVRPPKSLGNIRLIELRLAFHGKRVWYFTGLLRVLQFSFAAMLEVISGNYDVVCCGDVPYSLPGALAKAILGTRFVLDSHEIIWDCGIGRQMSWVLKLLEKAILKYCDLWLVPSDDRARVTLKAQNLDTPYTVLENFPIMKRSGSSNSERRSLIKAPPNIPVVMFQGTLVADRGIEELVEAAQEGGIHVVIQGVVIQESEKIKDYLDKNTHEGVTILPRSPNREVVDWLSLADFAFVYYKNDCLNSAYACSNKFYTAVFAGVPIICNRLPAFETFADKFGGVIFFNELSSQEINRSVSETFVDPKKYILLKNQLLAAQQQLLGISREKIIASTFEKLII